MSKEAELLQQILEDVGPFAYAKYAGKYESAINANAQAALVVRPSTVAALTIWNGQNHGGEDLVVDRIFSFNLVSTAAEARSSLWYCMHLDMTKPTNDITALRGTGDGREPDTGGVIVDEGATVLDDGWFPAGVEGTVEPTGVLPCGILQWNVQGKLVVPPRHGMSLAVVSGVVGNTFLSGGAWYRRQAPR